MVTKKVSIRFIKDMRGSFTVEAALIFPLLILFTVMMLFYGLAVYEKAVRAFQVFETAERAAYVWNDSNKDPITGEFSYADMDSPYSESIENLRGLTSVLFGSAQAAYRFPEGDGTGTNRDVQKLERMKGMLPINGHTSLTFHNRLLEKEIRVTSEQIVAETVFLGGGVSRSAADASSYASDPVEFIRTVDLVRLYSSRMIQALSRQTDETEKETILSPDPSADKSVISSEEQAKAFLKKVIGGTSIPSVNTSYGRREIDILDDDGLMHEAKYYVNKSDAKDQIRKDVELIRTGNVKGVVWHFFPIASKGKPDLTKKLRDELEKNGIIVIIHQ